MKKRTSAEDDDYGLLKKALDVEIPDDFDPEKIPENGLYMSSCVIRIFICCSCF